MINSGKSRYSSLELSNYPERSLKNQLLSQLENRKKEKNLSIYIEKPFNLFLLDEQAELYIKTIEERKFQNQIYKPLKETLISNLDNILDIINENIDFIDMGPGFPDKSVILLDFLKRKANHIRYIPVDISRKFLEITSNFFINRNLEIVPLNMLFEEIPNYIKKSKIFPEDRVRIFNLGFTFNNFHTKEILPLFSELLTEKAFGIIATELINDIEINKTINPYKTKKARLFNFLMLKIIGLEIKDFSYIVEFQNERIEMGFVANRDIQLSQEHYILKGDKILTSISYRYKLEVLKSELKKYFSKANFYLNKGLTICIIKIKKGGDNDT